MMKRLSKIALLAAAAFMLAGFPACSGDDEDEQIDVTNLTVSPNEVTLYVNGDDVPKSTTLTATVTPDNATDKTVKWLSSNTNVAEVSSETGGEITVTAKAAGTATITATAGDKKTATVQVTVFTDKSQNPNENPKEPPVEGDEEKTPPKEDVEEENPSKEDVEEPSETGGAYETLADGTKTGRVATTAPSTAGTITLYKNGVSQGTKSSVAEALAAISTTGSDNWKIELAPGTYEATGLNYKGSANITIAGKSDKDYGTDVLIVGQGTNMDNESTRSLLSFEGSANVVIKNLTLQNSHGTSKGTAQAETIGVGKSDFNGTLAAYNCSFLSGQDTICTEGKAWFYKCYIEGDVDFIWIESKGGKVALYEECVIRAIGTRTTNAYFTAPRLAVTNTVGKGVVIWNSTLQAEDGLNNIYLGRNPWDKETDEKKKHEDGTYESGYPAFESYYEQVAIVGTKFYSNKTLNPELWKGSGAHGTENQQFVGFKTDAYFAKSTKAEENGARRLTAAQVEAEYSDRNKILNRVYNIAEEKFENESASNIWDTSEIEKEFSAGASGDLEQEPFDPTSAKVVWDLASAWTDDAGKSSIQGSTKSGTLTGKVERSDDHAVKMFIDANVNGQNGKFESQSTNSRTQINAGTILTVPVTDGAIVSVTKNSGTFGIEGKETITYTHSGTATGIVIYCTANGYLTEVAVSKLNLTALSDDLKNATATGEVRAIGISDSSKEIMNGNTYKLAVTQYTSYGANMDTVSWTSDNESIATIGNDGIVTAKANSGTAKITATVNGHSATCAITAIPKAEVSKYTFDFRTASAITASANEDSSKSVSVSSGSAKIHGTTYGAVTNNASVMQVPVFANCTITVYQSYNAGANATLSIANATPASVTFVTTCDNKSDDALEKNKYVFTYSGSAGTADLTFSAGNMYFAKIVVEQSN